MELVGFSLSRMRFTAALALAVTSSSCGVKFSDTLSSLASSSPATAWNSFDAGTHLSFASVPVGATADGTLLSTVHLRDGSNQFIPNAAPVTLALFSDATCTTAVATAPSGAPALAGTTTVTATNGAASFTNFSIRRAQSPLYLGASVPGLSSICSTAFTVEAGIPSQMTFTTQPANSATATLFSTSPELTLYDIYQNLADNFTDPVEIYLATGTGVMSGTKIETPVNGVVAYNDLSINLAGAKSLEAKIGLGTTDLIQTSNTFYVVGANNVTIEGVDFPNTVNYTHSAAQSFVVRNDNLFPITLSSASVTMNAVYFEVMSNACGAGLVLAPNDQCVIQIKFKPSYGAALPITLQGTLTVDYSDGFTSRSNALTLVGPTVADSHEFSTYPGFKIYPTAVGGATNFIVSIQDSLSAATINAVSVTPGSDFSLLYTEATFPKTFSGAKEASRVLIRFAPTALGLRSGTLVVQYTTALGMARTLNVDLLGSGTSAPSLSIAAVTYPDTQMNLTSARRDLVVTNSGGGTAILADSGWTTGTHFISQPATPNYTTWLVAGYYSFSGNTWTQDSGTVAFSNCPAYLAPGATCTLYSYFTPKTTGTLSDTAVVNFSDGVTPGSVSRNYSGVGTATLTVAAVSSPAIPYIVGSSGLHSTGTFTVTNPTASSLTLGAMSMDASLSPSSVPNFRDLWIVGGTCANGTVLAPAVSCTVEIRFIAESSESLNYYLTIPFGGAAPKTFLVSGVVIPSPSLSISAGTFLNTALGYHSPAVTFTVSNPTTTRATIFPPQLSNGTATGTDFRITGGTCTTMTGTFNGSPSATVDGGATCTVIADFSPTGAIGLKSDQIEIAYAYDIIGTGYDQVALGLATRAISGTAVNVPGYTVSDLAFGVANFSEKPTYGYSTTVDITLANPNPDDAEGLVVALTGTGSELSISSNDCGATLVAGDTCTIQITFSVTTPVTFAPDHTYSGNTFTETLAASASVSGIVVSSSRSVVGVSAPFAAGLGTAVDPYQIVDSDQFRAIRDFSTYDYLQISDIYFGAVDGSGAPVVGQEFSPFDFSGNYNGGGFRIHDVFVDSSNGADTYLGLFRSVGDPGVATTINNLMLSNVVVRSSAGATIGMLAGKADNVSFDNIQSTGWTEPRTLESNGVVGGLVGEFIANASSITNINLQTTELAGTTVGGIVGRFSEIAGGTLSGLTFSSNATLTPYGVTAERVGGIIGVYDGVGSGTAVAISTISVTGSPLRATVSYAGGVLGSVDASGTTTLNLSNATVNADISGVTGVGGVLGSEYGGSSTINLHRVYTTGAITGVDGIGGLVGFGMGTYSVTEATSRSSVVGTDEMVGGLFGGAFYLALSDSSFTGTVTGLYGMSPLSVLGNNLNGPGLATAGIVGSVKDGIAARIFLGATSVRDTDGVTLAASFTGNGSLSSASGLYNLDRTPATVQPITGFMGVGVDIPPTDFANPAVYVGFDFTAGTGLWAIPTSNVNNSDLSPVLTWLCGTDGIACPP